MNELEKMFEYQKKFQSYLGIYEKIESSPQMKQQYINQMILAIQEETVEVMRESAYKNPDYVPFGWKENQEFNEDKFKDELVDLIHFYLNLCLSVNMDYKELFERYCKKNKINYKRQEENY